MQKFVEVTLPLHVVNFVSTENLLTIQIESLDHRMKGEGIFSPDTIAQTSDNFFQKPHDFIQSIQFIKNQSQKFQFVQDNILKIHFKYIMNKKQKIKIIKFPLTIQSNDELTILKLATIQLQKKVQKIQKQALENKKQIIKSLDSKVQLQKIVQKLQKQVLENKKWMIESLDSKEPFDIFSEYKAIINNNWCSTAVQVTTGSLNFCDFGKKQKHFTISNSNRTVASLQNLKITKLFKRKFG